MMLLVFPATPAVMNTILPFFSSDGLHWRQAVPGRFDANGNLDPGAALLPLDHFEIGGLYHFQGTYYATGQQLWPYSWLPDGKPVGRSMSIFRSRDFVRWSDTRTQGFIRWGYRSALPNQGEEVHMPAASWNRGNVIVGLYGQFHGRPGSRLHPLDLGLVLSNDGIHFREAVPDYVFMRHDPSLPWQRGGLVQGQGFFNAGDETRLYFSGWDGDVTSFETRAEIGMANLRRDGFGSLSVLHPQTEASCITCALQAAGKIRLYVNADGLSPSANLRVELLDRDENPIPNYSGRQASTVAQSGTRTEVPWNGGHSVGPLEGPFRIRVAFEGSDRKKIRFYCLYAGNGSPQASTP
jgi:hypothetical protein